MSLLTQFDQRSGTSLNQTLLRARVEQAMINKAIAILDEAGIDNPDNAERKTFAQDALANPSGTVGRLLPYIVQNPSVQTGGGEISDSDLLFVVQTEVIDGLYPAA